MKSHIITVHMRSSRHCVILWSLLMWDFSQFFSATEKLSKQKAYPSAHPMAVVTTACEDWLSRCPRVPARRLMRHVSPTQLGLPVNFTQTLRNRHGPFPPVHQNVQLYREFWKDPRRSLENKIPYMCIMTFRGEHPSFVTCQSRLTATDVQPVYFDCWEK